MKDRNELIEKTEKYLSEQGYGSGTNYTTKLVAYLIADFRSPQSDSDTITVKALRKRGTDRWYDTNWNEMWERIDFVDNPTPSTWHITTDFSEYENLPEDSEPITLECRIIKTEKP